MNKTLLQLREGARQRADMMSDSGAVSDVEANQYINEAFHELYDIITAADEAKLFTVHATKPPQVGPNSFRLPSDFYRLVSVHISRDGRYVRALPADASETAELVSNRANSNTRYRYEYQIRWNINTGERFVFVFPAATTDTLAITYWPQPKELSIDSESLDNPASWLEFVMVAAGVRMLNKVERDATALLLAKRQLGKRIQKAVYSSDFNFPRTIRDYSSRQGFGGDFNQW
jgi:hypothetical protein